MEPNEVNGKREYFHYNQNNEGRRWQDKFKTGFLTAGLDRQTRQTRNESKYFFKNYKWFWLQFKKDLKAMKSMKIMKIAKITKIAKIAKILKYQNNQILSWCPNKLLN